MKATLSSQQFSAVRRSFVSLPHAISGFTLIELMISMTLGLLVLAAISTIFVNTGKASREQTALARLQENARYSLGRISADIRMTGAQYCSSFGSGVGSLTLGHRLRPIELEPSAAVPPFGFPGAASVPGGELVSPRFMLQGHECSAGTCAPLLNVLGSALPQIPVNGSTAGLRAAGADVITVRYLAGEGIRLASNNNTFALPSVLNLTESSDLQAGEVAMVADCRYAQLFVPGALGGTSVTAGGLPSERLKQYSADLDARLFNFTRDMRTVSYFVGIRASTDGGPAVSVLNRQQNGQTFAISDGVERMELLYGVRVVSSPPVLPPPAPAPVPVVTKYQLTAAQVQNGTSPSGAALPCLPQPGGIPAMEPGCLWRQVETVDVSLLMSTVDDIAQRPDEPFTFAAAQPPLIDAVPPATLPSGLDRGRKYRREFRTRVNLRSWTY